MIAGAGWSWPGIESELPGLHRRTGPGAARAGAGRPAAWQGRGDGQSHSDGAVRVDSEPGLPPATVTGARARETPKSERHRDSDSDTGNWKLSRVNI
jgi:hypothetical protein